MVDARLPDEKLTNTFRRVTLLKSMAEEFREGQKEGDKQSELDRDNEDRDQGKEADRDRGEDGDGKRSR